MKNAVVASLLLAAGIRPAPAAELKTLPPAVYAQMKNGKRLSKLWLSPAFQAARGFRTGPLEVVPPGLFSAEVAAYLPAALARVARPESPAVLSLTVVELSTRERAQNNYREATVGVEGRVTGADGGLLAAFETREIANHGTGLTDDCHQAVDAIVAALAKELGQPLRKPVRPSQTHAAPAAPEAAPAQRSTAIPATPAAAPAPAVPAAPSQPATPATQLQPAASPALSKPLPAPAGPTPAAGTGEDPASRGHHY